MSFQYVLEEAPAAEQEQEVGVRELEMLANRAMKLSVELAKVTGIVQDEHENILDAIHQEEKTSVVESEDLGTAKHKKEDQKEKSKKKNDKKEKDQKEKCKRGKGERQQQNDEKLQKRKR